MFVKPTITTIPEKLQELLGLLLVVLFLAAQPLDIALHGILIDYSVDEEENLNGLRESDPSIKKTLLSLVLDQPSLAETASIFLGPSNNQNTYPDLNVRDLPTPSCLLLTSRPPPIL